MRMTGHKIESKLHTTQVKFDDFGCYIELPDEIVDDLGWNEDTEVNLEAKLGPNGNVLVVSKA